jgi:alkyl hydroperoxide reductase subunit AhpC
MAQAKRRKMGLLNIGEKFPEFSVPAVVSLEKGKEFATIDLANIKGKWAVMFFWPMDFNKELKSFRDRDAELYGISTDSKFVHLAWRNNHADLKNLGFPMLADNKKELSEALGVLHPVEKVPLRATYIVDPDGVVRWVSVNDLNVGRNVKEVIRTLDALQTDELCPCNWQKGEKTL